jgi:O-antigen ligase
MFLDWPVIGVGTGDFPSEVGSTSAGATIEDAQHAHSTYLHVLACAGGVGFALMAICLFSIVRNAWHDPQDSQFADAACFVLVSWLVAAQFDAYQQNGQMFGFLAWLAVISSSMRPAAQRYGSLDSKESLTLDVVR